MNDLGNEKKKENSDLYLSTLNAFSQIDLHLQQKTAIIKNLTFFLEKILFQKLPKTRISKYQKMNSMKDISSKDQVIIAKYDDTIKETLVKAENTLEIIKKETIPNDDKKKPPLINEKNIKKIVEKPKIVGKTRMASVENPRNRAKLKPISSKNVVENKEKPENLKNKPLLLKTPSQNLEKPENLKKNEEYLSLPLKITEKMEEKPKPAEFFLFRHENLLEKFSVQKDNFQIYFEIRKKFNATKKGYLETLNYYKEKNIKAQSKFMNKLENHFSEKRKTFREKFVKNDPSVLLTFPPEDKITKNVNFMSYSLQNYVKILSYYLEENSKEIRNEKINLG